MYQRRSLPVPDTLPLLVLWKNRETDDRKQQRQRKTHFRAQVGAAGISPQSARLPVDEGRPGIIGWGELQLLCVFWQVDFQLATVSQALVKITDGVRL